MGTNKCHEIICKIKLLRKNLFGVKSWATELIYCWKKQKCSYLDCSFLFSLSILIMIWTSDQGPGLGCDRVSEDTNRGR